MEANKKDEEENKQSRPGIPRPGEQRDQRQRPGAPPQPQQSGMSNQWMPPTTGNPDLDPAGLTSHGQRIDLREHNPLQPQGMLYDPRQLLDQQRAMYGPGGGYGPDASVPPGARFEPFGPPDPDLVGPGRGPMGSSQFGVPDPDHMQPPGMPQHRPRPPFGPGGKGFKFPGPGGFPPPGGAGGGPFM